MNWRIRDKLIHAICKGEALYIKNTGTKVAVDYYGFDIDGGLLGRRSSNNKRTDYPCHIVFLSVPTKKALTLCDKFHIKRNSITHNMEVDGTISLENLSLTPFESKGAKLLYAKNQKRD